MNNPVLGMQTRGLVRVINMAAGILFAALFTAPVSAFDLSLTLLDEDGNPVSMAVVEARLSPASAQAQAPIAIMDQINRQFVPMVLLIEPGQRVGFPNLDNVRHHVYSFSEIKQFSTPLYADEEVDPVQFDTSGIAVLGCNIHDSMVAYVYVSEWKDAARSDEAGQVALINMAERPQTLHIWHPWLQTPDNVYELDVSARTTGEHIEVSLPVVNPEQQFGFRALLPGGTQ